MAVSVEAPQKLRRNALQMIHVSSTNIANMAPAYSLYTTLGVIVAAAGVASPLLLILAGVATLFHVNATAEYSRKVPSAGSYTVFVARTFGKYLGGVTGWIYVISSVLLLASVYIVAGTWPALTFSALFGINIPWWIFMVILAAIGVGLCVRGIVLSTKWAIAFFAFEVGVILVGGIAMLVTHPTAINFAAFEPKNIVGGFAGLGLAFPLAVYPYLGASNAATMAEEVQNPKRAIRQAVFLGVGMAMVIYVFGTWATVVGYGEHVAPLTHAAYPTVDGAVRVLGPFGFLMYLGGLTSTMALVIVDTNAFARVWFNLGREGLLPRAIGAVHTKFGTPSNSILVGGIITTAIALISGLAWGATNAFDWTGTLGTIPMVLVFMLVNIGLPYFFWKQHRVEFSVFWHVVLPVLGIIAYLVPLWSTLAPGQPAPYNSFGLVTLIFIVIGMVYVWWVQKNRPDQYKLGENVVE